MNEEIQRVLKMSKEGTLTDQQAAELIEELTKKKIPESIGDTISALIGKTMEGAVGLSEMAGKNTSHVDGLSPGDLQANSFHMSRVEAPVGSDFIFQKNKVRMSHLKKLRFQRSELRGNQIDASKLDEISLNEGRLLESIVQASAVEELSIEQSEVINSKIISSKWARVSIEGESTLESVKFNASAIKGMKITEHSHWKNSVLSGAAVTGLCSQNSKVSDFEIQQARLSEVDFLHSRLSSVLFRGVHLSRLKLVECYLNDVLFSGDGEKWTWKPWKNQGLENVTLQGCKFDKVLISNCVWRDVTIKNVTLADFKIQDVNLSGVSVDGNEEFMKVISGARR